MTIRDVAEYVGQHTAICDAMTPVEGDVDVHFFKVRAINADRQEVLDLIADNPQGEFAHISFERASEGPSFIEWGAWIGDQGLALRLLGLGEAVGIWTVITPERIGVPAELRSEMAGGGYVMNAGMIPLAPEDIPVLAAMPQASVIVAEDPDGA